MKQNPDIHVKVVDVPNAGEVIKTRMLAGDVPDVINLYPQSIELKEWAKAGYLEDLTEEPYLENIKMDMHNVLLLRIVYIAYH